MKKTQAHRLWQALEDSTEVAGAMSAFEHKKGYGGNRTLERYVQLDALFRIGANVDDVAKKTGWSKSYVNKIASWWLELHPGPKNGNDPEPTEESQGDLKAWIGANLGDVTRGIDVYRMHLGSRIHSIERSEKGYGSAELTDLRFGSHEKAIIEALRRRDDELVSLEYEFEKALNAKELTLARTIADGIRDRLSQWVIL